ncbi:MAG: SBBP repeat-containing protein [Sedimentisphaerales bacterium]|nr:SBBP repeat-containing protein [Sedimentisphaerales bacterium]
MKKNLLLIMITLFSTSTSSAEVDLVWGKQFGSDRDERTRNLTIDSLNNVYVLGKTNGKVGKENFGKYDGFIVKVDSAANKIWAKQVGSAGEDDLFNATVDGSGNLYVTGYTEADANNKPNPNTDVLAVKLNSSGEIVWQTQYGSDLADIGAGITVNANGEIYVIGATEGVMGNVSKGKSDCFILHLDNEGNQLNVVQFGTSTDDRGYNIAIGADAKIYVCGTTEGNLAAENAGNSDIFWAIFTKELKQQKIIQYGTEKYDCADEIKTDDKNNIYIAGSTDWVLALALKQKMNGDCFLQKWNDKGEMCWEKQFGTSNWDGINGMAVIQNMGVIVSGCQNNPTCQSFCRMYDEDGSLSWSRNIIAQGGCGTCGKGVCVNQQGDIYHTGYTGANLFSELKGSHDVFLIKLKADMK